MRLAAAAGLSLLLLLAAGPGRASAQDGLLGLDPAAAGQATALLVAADESVLASDGRPAQSLVIALPRGMRVDPAARAELCAPSRPVCPAGSRIGFGRFIVTVRGYLAGSGESQLVWAIDAFLGEPLRRGDVASVVLRGRLLGIDSVAALLEPALGVDVPDTASAVGRLIRRRSGPELRFATLPLPLGVVAPITATPSRLELSLSAVRRVRENFVRRVKVRTLSGFEIRRIHDHRLVGHHLLRAPRNCTGSWPAELRVGFGGALERTRAPIPCFEP